MNTERKEAPVTAAANNSLTDILDQASLNKPGAIERFYQTLLDSVVYVPVDAAAQAAASGVERIGSGLKSKKYLEIEHEGHSTVAIFSEKNFIAEWAGQETPYEAVRFDKLIWTINEHIWLYLNPAQEVGKELSSWELGRLKAGKEAAAELAAELSGEQQRESNIEVRAGNNLFPEIKKSLMDIIEAYESIEAAFIIEVREPGTPRRPMVGLAVHDAAADKLQQLREELIQAAQPLLPAGIMLGVVDDLATQGSANAKLFEDATPFYFAQKRPMQHQSFLTRLLRRK